MSTSSKAGKSPPGLWDKLFGPRKNFAPQQVVVHGVSLGEVGLMSLVVPGIRRQWRTSCLLTTSTATGWQALESKWSHRERAWLPLDLPWAVERFSIKQGPKRLFYSN